MSSQSIRYNPNVTPAEGDDAVRFMARRLREDEGVQAGGLQGEAVAVYEGRQPAGAPERYIIVRELAEAGGRADGVGGYDSVPVQVVSSCAEDNASERQWHRVMHRRIRAAVEGQKLREGQSQSALPVRRTRKPARSAFPTGTGQSEQIAQYVAPIIPIQPISNTA